MSYSEWIGDYPNHESDAVYRRLDQEFDQEPDPSPSWSAWADAAERRGIGYLEFSREFEAWWDNQASDEGGEE